MPDNNTHRIWLMCQRVARDIYPREPYGTEYQDSAARLMLMTAAHESGQFRYRRQLGFSAISLAGAFGLGQTEWPPLIDSLQMLHQKPVLYDRVLLLMQSQNAPTDPLTAAVTEADQHLRDYQNKTAIAIDSKTRLLQSLTDQSADLLSFILMRLHYSRDSQVIPTSPHDQSIYAKRVYNTHLGAATPVQYLEAYTLAAHNLQEPANEPAT